MVDARAGGIFQFVLVDRGQPSESLGRRQMIAPARPVRSLTLSSFRNGAGANSGNASRCSPDATRIIRVQICRSWQMWIESGPTLAQIGPTPFEFGPDTPGLGHSWPDVDRVWANFSQIWSGTITIEPMLAKIGLKLAKLIYRNQQTAASCDWN